MVILYVYENPFFNPDHEIFDLPSDDTPLDEGDICPDEASENKNTVKVESQ